MARMFNKFLDLRRAPEEAAEDADEFERRLTEGVQERNLHRGMVKVEVWAWQCERCEHVWVPRDRDMTKEPKVCPHCKSPYWNRPRRNGSTGATPARQRHELEPEPELPDDPTGVDCHERYESPEDQA